MKNLFTVLSIISALFIQCHKDETVGTTCGSTSGITITNQTGKIYKWTSSEPNFFYIGKTTPVVNGKNGGYIPCNGLPIDFQTEGLIIQYSGLDKGSKPDTADPLFAYISITKIEKAQ